MLGEVALIQGALCGTRGRFELTLGKGNTSDSIYQQAPGHSASDVYAVEGYTFDDLFCAHFGDGIVDICKMDIEGAEYEVFDSSEHTALGRCRYFITELHDAPAGKQEKVSATLRSLGFIEVAAPDGRRTAEHLFRNENLVP